MNPRIEVEILRDTEVNGKNRIEYYCPKCDTMRYFDYSLDTMAGSVMYCSMCGTYWRITAVIWELKMMFMRKEKR